jgi:glycosyltransferase involved in cell wall biosynthesis
MSEGISNAVMEAMSMQLPVVCTDAGGMNELICDGHDGFLVPVLDPAALADKLLLLASDPELGKALGQRARQKILNDFSLDRQRNVYREEYAQQLAKLR